MKATVKKQRQTPLRGKRSGKRFLVARLAKNGKVKKSLVYTDEQLNLTRAGAQFIVQLINTEHTPNEATLEARKLNASVHRLIIH